MEKVTFPEFLTLSLLGIRWDGKITEDSITGVRTPERSKVTYHLEFQGETWFYHCDGERVEDVVTEFCRKFNLTSEEIGDDTFILHESVSGKVKNQQSLLRARARAVEGVYTMLVKKQEVMYEIDDRIHSMTEREKICDEYQEAYAAMTAFGYLFHDQHLDSSHPRTCQKCRFWKAEYDRKVAKVDSKPGTHIAEVS